jgi:hypothetical protein
MKKRERERQREEQPFLTLIITPLLSCGSNNHLSNLSLTVTNITYNCTTIVQNHNNNNSHNGEKMKKRERERQREEQTFN